MQELNDMSFDADSGTYRGPDGSAYVKCEFDIAKPVLIRVDCDPWRTHHNGVAHVLKWCPSSGFFGLLGPFCNGGSGSVSVRV